MTGTQFTKRFRTLTRCIFTVITGEAAFFLSSVLTPPRSMGEAQLAAHLPACLEHLAAGIVLYLLLAAFASAMVQNAGT